MEAYQTITILAFKGPHMKAAWVFSLAGTCQWCVGAVRVSVMQQPNADMSCLHACVLECMCTLVCMSTVCECHIHGHYNVHLVPGVRL